MFQVAFSDAHTLAIARVFDKPSKTVPTRSNCVVLRLMDKQAKVLEIVQPPALFDVAEESSW